MEQSDRNSIQDVVDRIDKLLKEQRDTANDSHISLKAPELEKVLNKQKQPDHNH